MSSAADVIRIAKAEVGVHEGKSGGAVERFWAKVDRGSDDACWNWTGARHSAGYGNFWTGTRYGYGHRFAYELLVGPIPEGLQLDHLCRNRACVNPAHLEAVTQRTNILRGETIPAMNAAADTCVNGHPYAGNTYMTPQGHRTCRKCRQAADRRRRRVS